MTRSSVSPRVIDIGAMLLLALRVFVGMVFERPLTRLSIPA